MQNAEKRTAIVTGASQGLGLAVAEKLLQEGRKVAFLSRSQEKLDRLQEKHKEACDRDDALFISMDVSDNDAIQRSVNEVLERWGRIDILVNNAGIRTTTSIEEVTLEQWGKVMSINLAGTFFFSQMVLDTMKKQGWGRIINMASISGQVGPLTSGADYAASNAGQIALTKVFARTYATHGITVNAIAPAAVRTPEMDKIPADKLEEMVKTIPVGRVGEAVEVADLCSYLVSDNGGFVTGATFDINGGRFMR